ncbi:MAG: sugar phosphate isomerase/epimerase [Nitrospirae bacterium]|nr:MAG: sugar phosphate isomerase/epimerase [Nitrospirota bacterium]
MIDPHVHAPYEKISEYLDFIIANRINLEIYFSGQSLDNISVQDLDKLKNSLVHSPSLSFHAPFFDLSPGAIDSGVRAATMQRFNQVLDIAEVLRPKCIVFHPGYEKWKYALNVRLWLEKSIETWGPLNTRAESIGVKIAIENIFEEEPSNLRMLVEEMASANFGICFDTGHFNLFSKVPLDEWLSALKQYFLELHLHDNDKSFDQHLPIGDGSFDFTRFFSEIKGTDCIYTIEAHNPERVMKSIERLKTYTDTLS